MPRQRSPARLYYRKDEGQWVIRDGTRQKRTGYGYRERKEAERCLASYIASKAPPVRSGPAHPGELTVGEVLARYADDKGPTLHSPQSLLYSMKALLPYWGDLTCDSVRGSTCRAYAKHRRVADGTARRELGVLQAALNYTHAEGLLVHPIKVTLPPSGKSRTRWLTKGEADKLIDCAAPHLRRFIILSLYTGRRMRAVLDLTWTQVDLDAGIIWFADGPETKKRRGHARIPTPLFAHLNDWRDRYTHVVHYRGRPVASIKTAVRRAGDRAGLDGVTAHVLKHTSITWAIMDGLTIEDAAEYFDTSPETIRKHYWHHSPHHQQRAIDIMEKR